MSMVLRGLLVIGALCSFFFVIKRIRSAKLKIEHAIFWIIFSGVLVIVAIFPQGIYAVSNLIGFQSPISMVYLFIIFILLVKIFLMTLHMSQLENKLDSLVQKIAIEHKIENELNDKEH